MVLIFEADDISVTYRYDDAIVTLNNNSDSTPPNQIDTPKLNVEIPSLPDYIANNSVESEIQQHDDVADVQTVLPENSNNDIGTVDY